jgi:small conductance mechanosensitive channel
MDLPFNIDFNRIGTLIVVYGVNCLGALAIALIGWWVASMAERIARRGLLSSPHMDVTVAAFLSSLVRYAVLAVTLVLMMQVVGIQATSLVAVIGASSLAIGLALQGTLSNMAAGVMLLIFRPFKLGDSIEVGGKSGTVRNLNLFTTELAGGDNVQVLIPNGQVWGQALTNTSAYATRRVSLRFPVPYTKDVAAIIDDIRGFLDRDQRVAESPPPSVTPVNLTDAGVELSVEAWAASEHGGALRTDLMHRVMAALQAPARPARQVQSAQVQSAQVQSAQVQSA